MITIVTDSTTGYSRSELLKLNIKLVKLHYTVDGIQYDENERGCNGDYIAKIRSGKDIKTSMPSVSEYYSVFLEIVEGGGEVLCVTLSKMLSGAYSAAVAASAVFGAKVQVVDSGSINAGARLLVDEAVNMVRCGLTLAESADKLEIIKQSVRVFFTVDKVKYLKQGGRINTNSARTILNFRPVFSLKDSIKFIGNFRGNAARIEEMIQAIPPEARRIFVVSTGLETDTRDLVSRLKTKFGMAKVHSRIAGPVITVHTGVGAIGIAYI